MSFTLEEKKEYWRMKAADKVRQGLDAARPFLVEAMKNLKKYDQVDEHIQKAFGVPLGSFDFLIGAIKGGKEFVEDSVKEIEMREIPKREKGGKNNGKQS